MTRDALLALIRQAALAPSVHNVQPARWRLADDGLILFEDLEARLSVGDPDGNDAAISLGAAVEGLSLAASQSGLTIELDEGPLPEATATLRPITGVRFENGAAADPLADVVAKRQSWRGMFAPAVVADRETLRRCNRRIARCLPETGNSMPWPNWSTTQASASCATQGFVASSSPGCGCRGVTNAGPSMG